VGELRRRHRLDIFVEVLRLAEKGAKMTRLVYQTNSNFTVMRDYLQILVERGFIESIDGHIYTTDKGFEFIDKYEELMQVYTPAIMVQE